MCGGIFSLRGDGRIDDDDLVGEHRLGIDGLKTFPQRIGAMARGDYNVTGGEHNCCERDFDQPGADGSYQKFTKGAFQTRSNISNAAIYS